MDFLEKLCSFLHITKEDYQALTLPPSIDHLASYQQFSDMDKVVDLILESIQNKEKIFIYGDYDCDGIMSTSILVKAFEKMGIKVGYYIPSRYKDGYGLNVDKVLLAHEKGYQMIITVDNGVCQFEAIQKAKDLGMKVIVTDHHALPEERVMADYILHPLYSHYGDVVCCGAYVAFMLSWALLKEVDPYLLDLAAIATISDMMELKDYNREIVRLALKDFETNDYPAIRLLAGEEKIDEQIISIIIAPKVNAIGRVVESTQVNRLVQYFTTPNEEERKLIFQMIVEGNDRRKEWTKKACENLVIDDNEAAIVAISDQKEGLIGLIANRLLQQYNKPVIIFAYSEELGVLKGSARSKNGFSIMEAFQELKPYFIVSGGHALAGGCSIKKEAFEDFKNAFIDYAKLHPITEEKKEAIQLSLDEITVQNYEIYRSLAPYGVGFEAPQFEVDGLQVSSLSFISKGEHIMTPISMKTKLVGFHINQSSLSNFKTIDIFGNMKMNYFHGKATLQFMIQSYLGHE